MKTYFSFAHSRTAVVLATTLLTPFAQLHAAPETTPASPAPAVQADPDPESTRVNMQFVDEDLKDIISFLRDHFPGANFMVQPKAENVRVTLNVRNVGMEQALQAVAFASDGRLAVSRMDYHFYGLILTDPAANSSQKPTCRVFNLSGAQDFSDGRADAFLDEMKESIMQTMAILRHADTASSLEMPELQFHRATRLLVAVGKPDSLAIVDQFVVALGGRATDMSQPAKNAAPGVSAGRGGFGGVGSYAPGIGNGTSSGGFGGFGGGGGVGSGGFPGNNSQPGANGFPEAGGKASNNAPKTPQP